MYMSSTFKDIIPHDRRNANREAAAVIMYFIKDDFPAENFDHTVELSNSYSQSTSIGVLVVY